MTAELISSEPNGSEYAVKRPSWPWLRHMREDSATYFVLIGHSHVELGRFTSHSLPLSSDENEMRSVDIRNMNALLVVRVARSVNGVCVRVFM